MALPQSLKAIQHWYRAIAPQLQEAAPEIPPVRLERGLCLLALVMMSLPLCVDGGLLDSSVLEIWEAESDRGDRLCGKVRSLLHSLNQRYHLGFPLKHLPVSLPLSVAAMEELHRKLKTAPILIEELGTAYELLMAIGNEGAQARKIQGAYFTPWKLTCSMVHQILEPLPDKGATILDPACGGGAFLLAAYEQLLQREGPLDDVERCRFLEQHIFGIDWDPLAVAVTRLSLLLKLRQGGWGSGLAAPDLRQSIHCGNSLVELDGSSRAYRLKGQYWQRRFSVILDRGGFDGVIGNPPYLDAEGMTRHQTLLRRYCTEHYRTAKGNWDLFCVFIERALSLCRVGGWHSFIVPNKLLSVPYGAAVRSLLATENRLVHIRDYSRIPLFSAAVYPITYRVQHIPPKTTTTPLCYEHMASLERIERQTWLAYSTFQRGDRPWQVFQSTGQQKAIASLQDLSPLSQWATVTDAATVAEAYAIQSLVQEAQEGEPGFSFVNSGTLDRYHMLWGKKPLRYLGTTYNRPVIPAAFWEQLPSRRLYQAQQPKILVASMTRHLEAFLDETGGILAGKSTTVILPRLNPYWLLGLLNSQLIHVWFQQTFGGHRLQGGYLRVGAAQVRQIPIRLPEGKLGDRLTNLVRQRIALAQHLPGSPAELQAVEAEIDALVYQIYGLNTDDIQAVATHG
ncbi:N-6 DNA methylase [Leptolyngbya sp. FACHB-16]|uniref:Eco57I restriction-modification methylase domain-containing protein n=1 Tax=unclassified Leptolyngbya TaxID=2650499 RepID=UPI001686EEE1|nr:N-6 DNA methylase [Leptolyngbya sp. FACHB-16]MBD2156789.1 N-6 DNA methylase [Leptolyngbya sp. FACHB-16]